MPAEFPHEIPHGQGAREGYGVHQKLANGNWRAEGERAGVRESAVRPTKAEVQAWTIEIEADLLAGKRGKFPAKTLAQTLERYERDISAKKASGDFEVKRFAALKRDHAALVSKQLRDVTSDDLARWRDPVIWPGLSRGRAIGQLDAGRPAESLL